MINSRQSVSLLVAKTMKEENGNLSAAIQSALLYQKVRFPLLEYAAVLLAERIKTEEQPAFCDALTTGLSMGSWVIAGKMLQLRLDEDRVNSLKKAAQYILKGNTWHVCDIVGERVMGEALLRDPGWMLPHLDDLAKGEGLLPRCAGVAAHYAIKKGLEKEYCIPLFHFLLRQAGTKDFHTKRGIGWAAKTMAKFHSDVITACRQEIDSTSTGTWFRTKVKIGLGRAAYATVH